MGRAGSSPRPLPWIQQVRSASLPLRRMLSASILQSSVYLGRPVRVRTRVDASDPAAYADWAEMADCRFGVAAPVPLFSLKWPISTGIIRSRPRGHRPWGGARVAKGSRL